MTRIPRNVKPKVFKPIEKIGKKINPITEKIDAKISGRNFESNIIAPMTHRTIISAVIQLPLSIFRHIILSNDNLVNS